MSRVLIPNTAQIPNVLFDKVMSRVSPAQFKVLMAVARKTYGWNKEADRISLSQLESMTGLSRRGIIDAIDGLAWILNKHSDGPRETTEYSINIEAAVDAQPSELSAPEVVNTVHQSGEVSSPGGSELSSPSLVNSVPKPSELSSHTKPILTKPNLQNPEERERAPALAEFDDLGLGSKHPGRIAGIEDWQKIEAFWRSKGKPKSIYQLEAYGLKLLQLKAQGHDPTEVVRKALRGGWTDLFGKEDTKAVAHGGGTVVSAQELIRRARERQEKARAQA